MAGPCEHGNEALRSIKRRAVSSKCERLLASQERL
jgi:hypothetical protein